jgi:acetolactate synthase-1/2/3 large subunit
MMGMHGEAFVNEAIQNADLLIALGMRFDDRVTGNLATYAQNAEIIHVDIDPAEIGKIVTTDVGIAGDVKQVLQQLLPLVEKRDRSAWFAQIEEWRTDSVARDILSNGHDRAPHVPYVVDAIYKATRDANATIVTDVGQHQMWTAQYYRHENRDRFLTSGGLGAMGYGVPAAIGAKFARPQEEVWAVVGDGGFQMSIPELATIAQEGLGVKIAIMRNGYLGMVRQWQELIHGKRYSEVQIKAPDFLKLADAYGIVGMRATKRSEVHDVLAEARSFDGPVLMDFVVEEEVNVYPMVAPGKALNDMLRRPMNERIAAGY